MSLAAVIERSHKDKEAWRYTDLEKLLGDMTPHPTSPSRGRESRRSPSRKIFRNETGAVLPPLRGELEGGSETLPAIVSGDARHQIVFINGKPQMDISHLGSLPKGVVQFKGNTCRLELEDRTCLATELIELVFVSDKDAAESDSNLQIHIGQNARLTIVEHHVSTGSQAATQVIETDIHLGAQSKLVHGKILHDQNNVAHLARAQVKVDEGGYYRNFTLLKDARVARNEIEVSLAGKLAQCALNGVMLMRGRQHIDTLTRITHAAPHGISRQLYKSVVKDQAQGVFQGKIIVAEGAQKTDGRQLSRALLLSDQAEMNAKPELEIYADDVSCSHGCTVGELDADALFYLRARGIDEETARAMLLRAFIDEAMDDLDGAEWRDFARDAAGRWLDE